MSFTVFPDDNKAILTTKHADGTVKVNIIEGLDDPTHVTIDGQPSKSGQKWCAKFNDHKQIYDNTVTAGKARPTLNRHISSLESQLRAIITKEEGR